MGLFLGMKKMDILRLAWNEIRVDKTNMIVALVLESILFLNIIVLLLFSLELDVLFDSYYKKNNSGMYSITIYNLKESHIEELEKDGFRKIEIFEDDENGNNYAFAQMDSLVRMDYKIIKWKFKGVTIEATIQDVLNVIIFVKAIFVFISVLAIFLGVLTVVNFYQMKVQKRVAFTNMLIRLGMPPRSIGNIYRIPFLIMNTCAIILAYVTSYPVLNSFNGMIQEEFMGISLNVEKRADLVIVIYLISIIILFGAVGNRWKRLNVRR